MTPQEKQELIVLTVCIFAPSFIGVLGVAWMMMSAAMEMGTLTEDREDSNG